MMLVVLESIELRMTPLSIYKNGELVEQTALFKEKHQISVEEGDEVQIKRGKHLIKTVIVKEIDEVLVIRTPRVLFMLMFYVLFGLVFYFRIGDKLLQPHLGSYFLLSVLIVFLGTVLVFKYFFKSKYYHFKRLYASDAYSSVEL